MVISWLWGVRGKNQFIHDKENNRDFRRLPGNGPVAVRLWGRSDPADDQKGQVHAGNHQTGSLIRHRYAATDDRDLFYGLPGGSTALQPPYIDQGDVYYRPGVYRCSRDGQR